MTQITQNDSLRNVLLEHFRESDVRTSEQGVFHGRDVRVIKNVSPPMQTSGESEATSLRKQRTRQDHEVRHAIDTPPPLLRQARYAPLPSADQLSDQFKPTDAPGFFKTIFTYLQNLFSFFAGTSADSQHVADLLERYHGLIESASGPKGSTGTQKARDIIALALDVLDEIEAQVETTLAPGKRRADPHQARALSDLTGLISKERLVLKDFLREIKAGSWLPNESSLAKALAFAREGVSLKGMAYVLNEGLSLAQADEARLLLDSAHGAALVESLENEAQAYDCRDSQFNIDERLLLEWSGIGLEGGMLYKRLGIPITRETMVTHHTDEYSLGQMEKVGSGAFNTVSCGRYTQPSGVVEEGIFKPLSPDAVERGWVAAMIGIDRQRPQIANRNLATLAVARELGFDVVTDCKIGVRRDEDGVLQLGLVMSRASGQSASDAAPEVFEDPEVMREITKLQILDQIVGQGDRHGGNYFIDRRVDHEGKIKVKVTGIDNDQCLGKHPSDPREIAFRYDRKHEGFRAVLPPQVIDSDMKKAILGLSSDRLRALLADKVSPDEVRAAVSRLDVMHRYVALLGERSRVISVDDWNGNGRPTWGRGKNAYPVSKDNSYFVRDWRRAVKGGNS